MDTNELKKLLKGSTAVLVLDNGEPSFVILGYDSYKNLLSDRPVAEVDVPLRHGNQSPNGLAQHESSNGIGADRFQNKISEKETELLEKINKEILALKDEITKEEKSAEVAMVDPDTQRG